MKLTNVQEEYLKTIFFLEATKNKVRVTDISDNLNRTKASVNTAIKYLAQEKLLDYETYGNIKLTELGKEEAIKIIEAHDIVELFLKDILKVKNENLQDEVIKMRTILSDDSLNKLVIYTHKVLGLYSLECGYDINKKRCINCLRRTERKVVNG